MPLIGFDKDEIIDFIPEYGGNRRLDDPCIVSMKFVPYARVQHFGRLIAARTKDVTDQEETTEIIQGVQKKQFIESVESISGYLVKGKDLTDPDEFYETADKDLIIEILRAMENTSKLSKGQAKNFKRASGGDT